jgi:hypothetical protein
VSGQDLIVIERREGLSQTGDDHLCLRKVEGSKYELSIRGYEFLGNIDEFCDDDGEQSIPDTIDGKEVVEVLPEFVVGGNLVTYNEEEIITFLDPKSTEVSMFLDEHWKIHWDNHKDKKNTANILTKICELCANPE